MAQFVSNLSKTVKTVPQNYVCPPHLRFKMDAPICKEIPVIDLSLALSSDVQDRAEVVEKLLKALDDSWGFQVINHGVSEKLMDDAMKVCEELFNLPIEDKKKLACDPTNSLRTGLYSGSDNPNESIQLWRETLVHDCSEQYVDSWPDKPSQYRKVIAEYSIETRKLTQKIFDLVAEGLGIEKQCFDGKFTKRQSIRANYYPKCPNPSLTRGISTHHDPSTITLIQQNASGLQIHKDEDWVYVQPLPYAFFVNTGLELQIISNGRFRATLHQAATNADVDRVSIGMFMLAIPGETGIEPATEFLSDENPPKYKAYSFEKYLKFIEMRRHGRLDIGASFKSLIDNFLI